MWRIPLSVVEYGDEDIEALTRVINGRWLAMGSETEAFETEFAAFVGVKHAIAVSSGTAALHLSYLSLGLGSGDQVIQPAVNFVSAASMSVRVGAEPAFAEIISHDEPTIDPAQIEKLIGPRTKAVTVMHYGGYPCRMSAIGDICRKHKLPLIEDACHAIGSRYADPSEQQPGELKVGNLGDIGCFSFYANKNLAIGEGGMVVTNHDHLAERLRLLRVNGMTLSSYQRKEMYDSSYDVAMHGYNYRLDDLRAALGRVQLRKLMKYNAQRKALAMCYRKELEELDGWIVPFRNYKGDSAYHLMGIVAPDRASRSGLVSALNKEGVQTSQHYPCITQLHAFASSKDRFDLPLSVSFGERIITLPLFPSMSEDDVKSICRIIRDTTRQH